MEGKGGYWRAIYPWQLFALHVATVTLLRHNGPRRPHVDWELEQAHLLGDNSGVHNGDMPSSKKGLYKRIHHC